MTSPPSHEQDNKNIDQFNKFLSNNDELLQQKYKEYFVKDSFQITGSQPSPETVVKYINDVFSFDKYDQNDPMVDKIEASLKESYGQFLSQNKNITQFNAKVAIDLLKFCIVNNQLFAVQYQMSQNANSPKNKNNQEGESRSRANKSQQHSDAMNNRSQMSNQFEDKNLGNSNSFDMENQFNFHEEIKPEFDPLIIKKNTKIMFEYYCKQQMSLAPNMSFERIERESSLLTLGKFIMMARLMNMFNSVITKDLLTKKFRKISEGKREIDFKKFDILLSQLQVEDPTLVARAELSSPNIYLHLKTDKKPFDTQDLMPRELIKNRNFNKKLTLHSGKMEEDLKAQVLQKKSLIYADNPAREKLRIFQEIVAEARARNSSIQRSRSKQIQKSEQHHPLRSPEIVSTIKLNNHNRHYSHDLNIISKIVPASHDDDKWLGQYKLKNSVRKNLRNQDDDRKSKHARNALLIRDLKNRIKQIEKTEQETSSLEETKPYLRASPSRRY